MGKNKKVDAVGVFLLCIAVASAVCGVSAEDVSVAVKKCSDGKCESQQEEKGAKVVVEVIVNTGGGGGGDSSESTTSTSTPSSSNESTQKEESPSSEPTVAGGSAAVEESIKTLCQGAMYKEACSTILVKLANGSGSTEEVIKAGATLALQGIEKILGVTESFKPKPGGKQPEAEQMAVDDCKDLFSNSVEKLTQAINQIGDPNAYKTECTSFTLRLWLSDVLTYADNCMDGAGEVEATDLQDTLKDGVASASEITMVILDVFTGFTKALNAIGVNPSNIIDTIKGIVTPAEKGGSRSGNGNGNGNAGRRLLSGTHEMMGDDGVPRWLSAADRKLLNIDGDRHERLLQGPAPNAVVAKDGSGQFKTIQDALNAYDPKAPLPPGGKYIIYVKAGIYDEYIIIESKKKNIFMYGDGPTKTIVTGKKSFMPDKMSTMKTASFAVQGANFFCKDMAFENTAGAEGHQAVAFRSNGEQHVFLNCHFNGYQDTLYVQGGSQFFRDCLVSGTVDFIFGNGATMIQHSDLVVRMPLPNQFNAVTAQGRTGPSMPTGIVIQDCRIIADPRLDKKIQTFLGRPWKQYARTVFMESEIGDLITPEGYRPFEGTPNTEDSIYNEYMNTGPGAVVDRRVKWPKVNPRMSKEEAQTFTVGGFLPGSDVWLKAANVPFYAGFKP